MSDPIIRYFAIGGRELAPNEIAPDMSNVGLVLQMETVRIEPGYVRPCTCHPDDAPPVPCQRKYALTDCHRAFHLQRVLVGGNHLALLIGADHPPHTANHETARAHYHIHRKGQDAYEAWCCWKTIMELRDAIEAGHV